MTSQVKHSYSMGAAEIEEVRQALAEILADPATADDARSNGLADDLSGVTVSVDSSGQGFDPVLIAFLVTVLGNLSSDALEALWTQVLYPRLRDRLGLDALGDERDPEQDD